MAKTDFKTIDEYQNTFSGEAKERMEAIRKIIHNEVSGVEETISYQIPCFRYLGYLIYYSAYPKHISLAHPFSPAFLEHFAEDLKKYKVSKSVIQLPNDAPLPVGLITEIIKFRKQENEKNPRKK